MRYLFISLPFTQAWWDQGHMLVAAVAEQALAEPQGVFPWTAQEGRKTLTSIKRILGAWSSDYPDFSDFISAAVWADHIKCRVPSPFCRNQRFDGIEIFNSAHFLDVYWNQSATANFTHEIHNAQYSPGNAHWLLNEIAKSLSNMMWLSQETDPLALLNIHHLSLAEVLEHRRADVNMPLNRHLALPYLQELSTIVVLHGTKFSYNLLLRLFIHVFGDIHQPLHAMSRITPCHPQGDRGGNWISVSLPADKKAGISNLHELWDSGGDSLNESYPVFGVEDARVMGRDLVRKLPPRALNPSVQQVLIDSHTLGRTVVYKEIPNPCLPHYHYTPSDDYMRELRATVLDRITQAGYGLAIYLHLFLKELPESLASTLMTPSNTVDRHLLENSVRFWRSLCLVSTTAALALGYLAYSRQHLRGTSLEESLL
eukprot:Blabericola_migrator_1__901@NODE_1222_length_5065_cov_188_919768_g829_i0_p2_GENE_NODE_1222_length_5065_cov_188_919768_g829_i0NODE_1222_length_5065_cov_188_919768_g829_i0_p2_ORF_typecomplete_len427_score69_51S1P1_nuclease/PF02265_16/6_2e31_NODE_1222_length_5065_cov_188_919768_g829_i032714551